MENNLVTLQDIFTKIDGQSYACARELEEAVVGEVNERIVQLPVGFSYKDAIGGALERGWLRAKADGSPGVKVEVSEEETLDTKV